MGSEDEFDGLDSPKLTAEEWAEIDERINIEVQTFERKSLETKSPPTTPSRRSQTPNFTSPRALQPKYPPTPSPMRATRVARAASGARRGHQRDLISTYRPTGHLSVSDLVGPAWCEVKFDYNLRWAPRWQRTVQKPDVLVTAKGKEIEVRKDHAQRGEAIRDAGTAVHKVLEKALQPVEIEIPVNTREERWGSKLLTMLSGLQLLKTIGYCREFPVVGFINEIMVLGVIDEISRRPLNGTSVTPQKSSSSAQKEQSAKDEAHQTLISQYFGSATPKNGKETTSDATSDSAIPQSFHALHVTDYKTRNAMSMPPVRDQYQSRLQLMLYRRLLGPLLDPGSFIDVFNKLAIDTSAPFSAAFIQTQGILCISNGLDTSVQTAMCVGDLMVAWIDALPSLNLGLEARGEEGVALVDDELEIVYRLRKGYRSTSKQKSRSREPSMTADGETEPHERTFRADVGLQSPKLGAEAFVPPLSSTSIFDDNDAAMAWAIQESLSTAAQNAAVFGSSLESQSTGSSNKATGTTDTMLENPGPSVQAESLSSVHVPLRESAPLSNDPNETDRPKTLSPPAEPQLSPNELSPVVGVSTFKYDAIQVDEYISDVLKFWRSEREPKGVDIEDSNRCNMCEFRDGCEWRERKVAESQT